MNPNNSCLPASEGDTRPFRTNPTECASPEAGKSAAPVTTVRANSWYEPQSHPSKTVYTGAPAQGTFSLNGRSEKELFRNEPSESESLLTGCDQLRFQPEIKFVPSPASAGGTTQADAPTGMTLDLKVPQAREEPEAKATPALRKLEMTLPKGMTVSPSSADGLEACTKAQFWPPENGAEPAKHREPAVPAQCPLASQIGTAEVFTPLLSGAPVIEGEVGVCRPGAWSGGPWEEGPEGPSELVKGSDGTKLTLSYQWLRNGDPIAGKTSNTDGEFGVAGEAIQCQVTASNKNGSSVAVSHEAVKPLRVAGETVPLAPLAPSSIAPPSGTASVGGTLTCQGGVWTGSPTFAYRWLRDAVPIAGAESSTYTLTAEDQGNVVQCQVIGKNSGGTVLANSAAVVVGPLPSPAPPLPGAPLQGQLFVGQPECSPCTEEHHDAKEGRLLPLFLQVQDPSAGLIVKLHGVTSAEETGPLAGQLTTKFEEQPQQPFELLQLKLKGGPRAPLASPQTCGPVTTTTDLTPWSAPGLGGLTGSEPIAGTPDATPSSSFNVEGCPATLPFNPSFNAGTTGPNATTAGESPSFSLTFSREDREQDLSGIQVRMPLGLVGKIAGIPRCGEAQANAGTCGPESQIGTATSLAGPGPDPFPNGGRVYLTDPYKGAPFGLSFVTSAVAGPFNLGNVVVRSAISIDPHTAAVTVTSDPLPQFVDGVQLRLRKVNLDVNRSGFMLNPTNCSSAQVSATLTALQGASAPVSSPFGLEGCNKLPFKPKFTASTQAHTSKANGASLDVKITYPQGAYANIAKTVTELPTALPSRLTTIQKSCVDKVFEANPAACPEGSVIGYATAHTPVLNQPLVGPAYLISHGNRAFPDLEIVLQGEGVTVILDGQTDIKKGITKTTFNAIPDAPVSTFELKLPQGPHSALAANVDLCSKTLKLPTILTGQNGAVIKQNTKIAVNGCPPTVQIIKTKLKGNALLVTVKTSAKGTVSISGKGLKTTTKKNLTAGTHQIRVALTKTGTSMRAHRKKTTVRAGLTVAKQPAVAKTTTVRL